FGLAVGDDVGEPEAGSFAERIWHVAGDVDNPGVAEAIQLERFAMERVGTAHPELGRNVQPGRDGNARGARFVRLAEFVEHNRSLPAERPASPESRPGKKFARSGDPGHFWATGGVCKNGTWPPEYLAQIHSM